MGSLVISDKTFSHVHEMASTESNTGAMIEGNCNRAKKKKKGNYFSFSELIKDPQVHMFD